MRGVDDKRKSDGGHLLYIEMVRPLDPLEFAYDQNVQHDSKLAIMYNARKKNSNLNA